MEDIIKSSIIKGLSFSIYDKLGPQPIYMFPSPIKLTSPKNENTENFNLTTRDHTQIAIKGLSLLIGDGSIFDTIDVDKFQYFGIIPFPDFSTSSLTFYHFVNVEYSERPLATAFCILVDENKRSFLFNNINRLKNIILDFFQEFDKQLVKELKPQDQVNKFFYEFAKKLVIIESTPSTPVTTNRKMKILFAGLDDTGKTSFLLTVDRKFSKLIGLKPTRGAKVNSIEALGATLFLWDLGGQESFREKYLRKGQIYLFEADLLFFFIDVTNQNRFKESFDYLKNIKKELKKIDQDTPIIYILSKGDPDIIDTEKIKTNIKLIKKELKNGDKKPEIYITSIFQIFSVLRAFSSGIAKLSPNRDLINHNLTNFASETESSLSLLLSVDGLVLADFFSPTAIELTDMPKTKELINIFELTGPQFATLFKIFAKYKASETDDAVFKVSKSVIYLKKIKIFDNIMFILFLLDNEDKKDLINQKLPDFLNRTQDLVIRYIA